MREVRKDGGTRERRRGEEKGQTGVKVNEKRLWILFLIF